MAGQGRIFDPRLCLLSEPSFIVMPNLFKAFKIGESKAAERQINISIESIW
jgi:hypothetical protein